jgi:hypothetical protein
MPLPERIESLCFPREVSCKIITLDRPNRETGRDHELFRSMADELPLRCSD